jgi:hypothetical protein
MLIKSLDNELEGKYILGMKMRYFISIISVAIIATVYAGAFLDYFHGRSEGEDIRLEWKTGEEVDIKHFSIERKTPNNSYAEIANLNPQGSNSYYSYLDKSAYKMATDLVFIYRLKIVDNSGQSSYSNEVTVSHNVSGVKRTWGSIKAMFR